MSDEERQEALAILKRMEEKLDAMLARLDTVKQSAARIAAFTTAATGPETMH